MKSVSKADLTIDFIIGASLGLCASGINRVFQTYEELTTGWHPTNFFSFQTLVIAFVLGALVAFRGYVQRRIEHNGSGGHDESDCAT